MATPREPLLRVEGVSKRFPGVKALKGVSFDLERGEVHAICGENGAGKSTLIKVLTGVHQMDEGAYLLDGEDARIRCPRDAIDRGVACIYQEMSIVPQFDVAKNLYLGHFPLRGGKRGFIDEKRLYSDAQGILDRLGVKFSPRAPAGSLSVGQQQMVEIGRALTRNARIIILDEPTSSLSEKEIEVLLRLIETLSRGGVAVIYISHKLDEVLRISRRITVLRDGERIVTVDTKDITKQELITSMLGRSLDNMFPRRKRERGELAFAARGLARKGAFEGISFELRRGEVLGFFGLIGAGRTEIMRGIFGADKLDSGEVLVGGRKLGVRGPAMAIRNGIGFATENRKLEGLALQLPILLNMTLVSLPRLSRLGVIDRKRQALAAGEFSRSMNLKAPSLAQPAGNLSGGNQQKVVVAKWLMTSPKVLILDEPTRGVDVGSKAEIYDLVNELAAEGMAVIVVSSEIEEVMGLCDRVVVIAEGRQIATLDTEGLSSERLLTAAFGGEA